MRTASQRAMDLEFILKWHSRRRSCRQIAEMIEKDTGRKISRAMVQKELTQFTARTIEKLSHRKQAEIVRDLDAMDEMDREAWDSWEKSKLNADKTVREQSVNGRSQNKGDGQIKVRKETEAQCGDVQYLRVIQSNMERRAKLLGMDAPTKQELSGPDGGPIETTLTEARIHEAYKARIRLELEEEQAMQSQESSQPQENSNAAGSAK